MKRFAFYSTPVTKLAFYSIAIAVFAGLAVLQGCAATPPGRYAQVNDTFIATVQTLNQAKVSGLIDQQTWDARVLPLINSGNSLLDSYSKAVLSGQPTGSIAHQLAQIITALQPYLLRLSSPKGG